MRIKFTVKRTPFKTFVIVNCNYGDYNVSQVQMGMDMFVQVMIYVQWPAILALVDVMSSTHVPPEQKKCRKSTLYTGSQKFPKKN